MRFTLIDRITSLEAGKSIRGVKNLSLAEEYLQDHFPGFPVMPGVLMLESLVQTSAWLMRFTEDFKYSTILLKQAKAVRFNNFVAPGHALHVEIAVHEMGPEEWVVKASGMIDGTTSAVNARLTLRQFNLADTNPKLAAADEKRIDGLRVEFSQLWTPAIEGEVIAATH